MFKIIFSFIFLVCFNLQAHQSINHPAVEDYIWVEVDYIKPVYKYVEITRERCDVIEKEEPVMEDKEIIGGIAGGLIGAALTHDKDDDTKAAAVGVGVLLGAEIGDSDGIEAGETVGSIAGGVAGSQVGKGNGKAAATGAGVLSGRYLGSRYIDGKKVHIYRECRPIYETEKVISYYVIHYNYNGKSVEGRVKRYPKNNKVRIKVR